MTDYNYTMTDEVRSRLNLPTIEQIHKIEAEQRSVAAADNAYQAIKTGIDDPPRKHFHIFAEEGWAGALSPILPSLRAVNELFRQIRTEPWVEKISADTTTFVGSLFFAHRREGFLNPTYVSEKTRLRAPHTRPNPTLRLVVEECDGTRIIGQQNPMQCNDSGQWR